jgi:tetratricopeptide (TPR) repeat protein
VRCNNSSAKGNSVDLVEQIRVLEAAQGDPARLALATVDLAYSELPESERAALGESLEAAAISHWCNESILTALLEIPSQESALRLSRLSRLSVVEPFRARGDDALDVHEASRIALRKRMAAEDQARFRTLSGRMAAHFEDDLTAAGRIEWIYHLLCSDQERGATELEKLDRHWSNSARPEHRYALASALAELEDTSMVRGRARAWVLLAIAWTRVNRGGAARLVDVALSILDLARSAADPRAEGDAYCLLGDALRAQGKLVEAQAAFGEFLTISRRLAERDPSNVGWQRDLAVAERRVGGVLQVQSKLGEAQAAFEVSLTINRRLAEQDPNNAGWQRDLAVALGRLGGVLKGKGKLTEALAAFKECLMITQWLAEQDPTNGDWQRELAVAQSRVGDVLQAQGKLPEAQAAFGEYLTISRRLAEHDPSNASSQRGLAVAQSCVGIAFQAQGKLTEAQAAFGEYLTINRRLAEQDPSNADWQRGLAVAQSRMGSVLHAQGRVVEAQAAVGEYLIISRRLAEQDPSNAGWQHDLALAYAKSASLESEQGSHRAAILLYEEASSIFSTLLKGAEGSPQWVTEKETVDSELRSVRMIAEEE